MITAALVSAFALLLPSHPGGVSVMSPRQAARAATPSMRAAPEGPKGFAPSTKDEARPQQKPKAKARPQQKPKAMVDRFDMQFTCKLCETRNEHSISRKAYTKGTVIVTCPGCDATHLVADNLNWIEDDFKNLEEFMAKQGKPVTRIAKDGVAAAAAAAVVPPPAEEPDAASATVASKVDGISDDQATRIRDAVRKNKQRNRED